MSISGPRQIATLILLAAGAILVSNKPLSAITAFALGWFLCLLVDLVPARVRLPLALAIRLSRTPVYAWSRRVRAHLALAKGQPLMTRMLYMLPIPKTAGSYFALALPANAEVLAINVRDGKPFLHAVGDLDRPLEYRYFCIATTAHELPEWATAANFRGSIPYVLTYLHIFECPDPKFKAPSAELPISPCAPASILEVER